MPTQRTCIARRGAPWLLAAAGWLASAGLAAATGSDTPAALAPAFNAERFSDATKVEKWFRRNCNNVLARECSASEKADVLAWLLTLKP